MDFIRQLQIQRSDYKYASQARTSPIPVIPVHSVGNLLSLWHKVNISFLDFLLFYVNVYIKKEKVYETAKEKIIYICIESYRTEYGTVRSVMTVPITVLRMVPIQRYRHFFSADYTTGILNGLAPEYAPGFGAKFVVE